MLYLLFLDAHFAKCIHISVVKIILHEIDRELGLSPSLQTGITPTSTGLTCEHDLIAYMHTMYCYTRP